MIVELNESNFDSEALHGLKVIEFYATWCVYCKRQRMEFIEFENSDVWIGIVDGDESPNLVQKYKINGYPTFVLLKDGQEIGRFSGFHDKSQLLSRLTNYIV